MSFIKKFGKISKLNLALSLCLLLTILTNIVVGVYGFHENTSLKDRISQLEKENQNSSIFNIKLKQTNEELSRQLKTPQEDFKNTKDKNASSENTIIPEDEALKIIESAKTEKIEGWKPEFVTNTTSKKLEKIADIPEDILNKIGVPAQGFVFHNNIVYWSQRNDDESGSNLSIFNGSKINTIIIKEINSVLLSPVFNDKYINLYDCGGFGGGCRISTDGAVLNFENGTYFKPYQTLSEGDSNKLFNFFQNKFPEERRGDAWTGYQYYTLKSGFIYGRFKNKIVKSDGQSFEVLFDSVPVGQGGSKLLFNSNGNLVYVGGFDERQFYGLEQGESCVVKNQFAEQDIKTGDALQFATTYHNIDTTDNCSDVMMGLPNDIISNKQKYEKDFKDINSKFKINLKESDLPFVSLT